MASVGRLALLESTALTATTTGDSKSTELHQTDFLGWLNVSANDGSTTVDVDIEHSPDGQNWVVAASFTQLVNVTGREAISIAKLMSHVRAVVTLAGTPSATVEVLLLLDKRK